MVLSEGSEAWQMRLPFYHPLDQAFPPWPPWTGLQHCDTFLREAWHIWQKWAWLLYISLPSQQLVNTGEHWTWCAAEFSTAEYLTRRMCESYVIIYNIIALYNMIYSDFLWFPKQCGHTEGVLTVRVKRGTCRSRWGRGRPAFFL